MILRDDVGQRGQQRRRQAAGIGHAAQHVGFGEARHLQGPFDDLATPAERQPAVRAARDRNEAAIDAGRVRLVDLELATEHAMPALEGGEIHVVVGDGSLDLEDAIAGQEDMRAMRRDARDGRRGRVIGRGA